MVNIKLIIFDLDGTLVDAYQAIIRSFNYTLQKLGYPRQSNQVIRRAVGWGDKNLLRPFVKTSDLAEALSIYRKHHQVSLIKYSRLFPKALKVLNYFKNRDLRLAVASNRPRKFSLILMRHLGLKNYFDYILCSDRLRYSKPHPEILNKIMQRFSSQPAATLYVGDMAIDAQAGRRAKVKTVIVTTGSSAKGEIKKEKPFRVIGQLSDLLTIF